MVLQMIVRGVRVQVALTPETHDLAMHEAQTCESATYAQQGFELLKKIIFLAIFPKNPKFYVSPKFGFWDMLGYFGELQKCARRNFTQNAPVNAPRSLI